MSETTMAAQDWNGPDGDVVLEAREIGWPPGQWAQSFKIDDETFVYVSTDNTPSGDIAGWRYTSNQRKLLVIND